MVEKLDGDASDKEMKGPAEEEGLEERLKAAEARADENYDRLLRITAELENYKKITVDRELKMVELKKEINKLLEKYEGRQKYF